MSGWACRQGLKWIRESSPLGHVQSHSRDLSPLQQVGLMSSLWRHCVDDGARGEKKNRDLRRGKAADLLGGKLAHRSALRATVRCSSRTAAMPKSPAVNRKLCRSATASSLGKRSGSRNRSPGCQRVSINEQSDFESTLGVLKKFFTSEIPLNRGPS